MKLRLLVFVMIATCTLPAGHRALAFTIERVSVASDGTEANSWSAYPKTSADGRYVAFLAGADNLVPDDLNYKIDVFLHDRLTGSTELVSRATDGTPANGHANYMSMSADGRYLAFSSTASNLVPNDTNGKTDVFVHDRLIGTTTRVSVASGGAQGDDDSWFSSLSADGRYVAFASHASTLVPGDTNGCADVFLHDQVTGSTHRVSVAGDGTQGNDGSAAPSLSADGRYVAFVSDASNLVPGDTNGQTDVFVHERLTGVTTRVSVRSDGGQADCFSGDDWSLGLSADGRFTVFDSAATNLVPDDTNGRGDIFLHDGLTGTTALVSVAVDGGPGNWDSYKCSVSADGRYIAFSSYASNLVPSDTNSDPTNPFVGSDIFLYDRIGCATAIVNVASDGTQSPGESYYTSITADGGAVAFFSTCAGLVPGDNNASDDVFIAPNALYTAASGSPSQPTDLVASAVGAHQVYLAWADCSDSEIGFRVERSLQADAGFVQVAMTAPNSTNYTDYGLSPTTPYYYRVRASNAAGHSPYSNTASVTTEFPLAAPSNLETAAVSTTSTNLSWTDNSSDETGFRVERRTGAGTYSTLATLAADVASYQDTTCTRATAYTYRVCATGGLGDSDWSNEATTTTPTFDDVLPSAAISPYVEAVYQEGITGGCSTTPPLFCPNSQVTRGQMAVFLCRAAGWTPVTPATPSFTDVPATDPQYGYIEAVKAHGVTSGCTATMFCPNAAVTRGQMAVFLCRAAGIAPYNKETPTFGDVPKTNPQYSYIEALVQEGVTSGCAASPPRYCPTAVVTRGQTAVFLCRAFGIGT